MTSWFSNLLADFLKVSKQIVRWTAATKETPLAFTINEQEEQKHKVLTNTDALKKILETFKNFSYEMYFTFRASSLHHIENVKFNFELIIN